MTHAHLTIVLVTGLSGAGKSHTLNMLEDCGFEAIDNLPLSVLPLLMSLQRPTHGKLAVGMDIRTRDFSPARFERIIRALAEREDASLKVLFLDAENDVLVKRYKETRRLHPLAKDRPVADGIRHERKLLAPLRMLADDVLDTTDFTPKELQREVEARFCSDASRLHLFLTSFAFRNGIPREADLVLDVRFLRNPHYDPDLREKDGRDPDVAAYIREDPDYDAFLKRLEAWLLPLFPRYLEEGKHYLTIAVGCTGGKHRSVHIVEALAARIRAAGDEVSIRHREVA